MKNDNILASENFCCGSKHYFLDFKIAKNNSNYICITRSDLQPDGTYQRQTVTVFEEHFHVLIGCMSSLFRSAAYKDEQEVSVQQMRVQAADNWLMALSAGSRSFVRVRKCWSGAGLR